jgi:putative ABC transport system permease protein
MYAYRLLRDRLRALLGRDGIAEEIHEEIQFHLGERMREYERRGLPPGAARRAALQRFGNPSVVQDRGYDVRGGGVMESILQDVRYAVRLLRKQPAFTAVALITLALGIGVTTALFSVIEAALLRPLPYPHPEELVTVDVDVSGKAGQSMRLAPSIGDIRTWRDAKTVFSHIGMGRVSGFVPLIVDAGTPERLTVAEASEDLLETYGIAPILGRGIQIDDTREGAPAVALLGYGYWRSRFAGDSGVLGRSIRIGNVPLTIVGVLPAGFYRDTSVWQAKRFAPAFLGMRGSGTPVVGRLRPGVSLKQAARELDALTVASTTFGPVPTPAHVSLESLYRSETSEYGSTIKTLTYAVGLILIIACVNVAGLLLARGATRHVELAIRASIGAGRARLLRQLLTESVILALGGASLGLLFAWLTLDSLVAIIPLSLPPNSPATISVSVLTFTLALSVTTALLFGLVPALRLSRVGIGVGVQLAAASRSGVPLPRRLGQLLIGTEVALALVLVSGSGLMVRSFARLVSVDVGYDPARVLTMEVEPLDQTAAVRNQYYPALTAALAAMPQVAAVGAIDRLALTGGNTYRSTKTDSGAIVDGPQRTVLPGYFEAIGVRPIAGRLFVDAERGVGESPVVVNAAASTRYFSGSAVGHTLETDGRSPRHMRIVGVVPNLRHRGPAAPTRPEMYILPDPNSSEVPSPLAIVMRLRDGASVTQERLKAAADSIGPRVLVGRIRPGTDLVGEQVAKPRHRMILLSLLGGFGLLLTLVGIFSMTAYAVARRTREIGIRMAFGARPGDVVRHVVGDTVPPLLIGLAVGLGGAFYATRVIAAFLFETTPHDPGTFVGVVALIAGAACLAAWIPARRAAKVEPVAALRAE